jgi:hypothetical protein
MSKLSEEAKSALIKSPLTQTVNVIRIGSTAVMSALMEALRTDEPLLYMSNKELIWSAWRRNLVYGLSAVGVVFNDYFDRLIFTPFGRVWPIICAVDENNVVDFVWTGKDCRGNGLAATLINALSIDYAHDVVKEAEPFWTKMGFAPYEFCPKYTRGGVCYNSTSNSQTWKRTTRLENQELLLPRDILFED